MRFGSLFSGIGGFDLGFARAGMTPAWNCEIDPKASEVLKRHWPNVPNLGDVKNVGEGTEAVDVISGGFPCQDLSVAGRRAGLAGERSGLWFEFHRIVASLRPRWVVIENVPGLLSSNAGQDFAVILRGLVECGYGVAWRVLDAQYFGVAQRRRRVFIVGSLGSGRAAEVLFEREGMSGDPPARGEAGQVTSTLFASGAGTNRPAGTASETGFLVAPTLASHHYRDNADMPYAIFQQNTRDEVRLINGDGHITGALAAEAGMKQQNYVARSQTASNQRNDGETENFVVPSLQASAAGLSRPGGQSGMEEGYYVPESFGVRRLTPTECERLQGFPDGWTDGQADSSRYRQLGNAVAVPVVEWIGSRLVEAA